MTVKIKRLNDAVHMQATNEDGVSLQMDGIDRIGGINGGFRPMEMLLAAVGGCSAIEVGGERVAVEGEKYTEFKTIHIHFKLSGAHLDENKIARAIDLSLNKYCSVSKTLEKTATITSSFEIVG